MNETKHTVGEWTPERHRHALNIVARETQGLFVVAQVRTGHPTSKQKEVERQANAHLIAAAPDLLAACEAGANDGVNMDEGCRLSRQTLEMLTAAIFKAKGGAE